MTQEQLSELTPEELESYYDMLEADEIDNYIQEERE